MPHTARVELMRRFLRYGALSLVMVASSSLPAAACTSCAAAFSIAANTASQVAQIGVMTEAIVAAIGDAGGGAGSADNGPVASYEDAAKSEAEFEAASTFRETYRVARARNTLNTQSTHCRLGTKNLLAPAADVIAKAARNLQERGVIDGLFFNTAMTPARIATGAVYRLCQNGQLAPADFGQQWFTVNNCIDDPTTAHDFLKISTVLDSPVLIPPPQATMDILNNPEASAPAAILAAWNGLNDKQKKYVGAQRYCENLITGRIKPQDLRGDSAMSPGNMALAVQNFSAIATLSGARDMCADEMTRRVAIDPVGMAAGAVKTAYTQNSEKLTNFLVNMRGSNPRELYAYASQADYTANNPIPDAGGQPKPWISQYIVDRMPRDYGLSIKCSSYSDSGSDAARTGNALGCAQLATKWEQTEEQRRKNFMEAVAAISRTPDFGAKEAAPMRARYSPEMQTLPLLQDAELGVPGMGEKPMPLRDIIQAMDAARNPTRSASATK